MATRRCLQTLTRDYASILSSNPYLQSLKTLNPYLQQTLNVPSLLSPQTITHKFHNLSRNLRPTCSTQLNFARHFSSNQRNDSDNDEENESEEESGDENTVSGSNSGVKREYSLEEREEEAAAIGYKVIGPLNPADRVFKPYEPVFAVVQIGSHQFRVSNGDSIFTERLKFCDVNDKLILNRVLMLGSTAQTMIGRPLLPDAAVHAVVEEHALDAKVIIFKKKRRKNYRRTKGHRQELTKLRITDIQGIEKPENTASGKTGKATVKEVKKVAVAA